MTEELFLNILFTLGTIGYAFYLDATIKKGKTTTGKYPLGSRAHELYQKIYTPQFLKVVTAFAITRVLDLGVDAVILSHANKQIVSVIEIVYLAINFALSIYIIVWLYRLFVKKTNNG